MYMTLTDIQNGEQVYLTRSLSGGLEVALCELTYYHQWYNIRGVGRVSNKHTAVWYQMGITTLVNWTKRSSSPWVPNYTLVRLPDLLQLTTKSGNIMMSSELAKVLGFSKNTFEGAKMLIRNGLAKSGETYTANEPHMLAVHREVYIHLAELSTSENLTNGQPSTLLRSIPVENEKTGCRENFIISSLAT